MVVLGLLLSLLAFCLELVDAAHVLDVYRCIQFDKGTSEHGCRKTYLSATASAFDVNDEKKYSIPVRQALVVRIEDLTLTTLETLLQSSTVGILILLPASLANSSPLNNAALAVMKQIENRVFQDVFEIPIYFAVETTELTEIYESLKSRTDSPLSTTSDDFTIVVSDKEAEAVPKLQVTTVQGVLPGKSNDEDSFSLGFITHYDTISAVPGLSRTLEYNGSGVVALLELLRLFSKLYNRMNLKTLANLAFLLNGGGRLHYFGARQWVANSPATSLAKIEFALCLESIAGESLYLHLANMPKSIQARQFIEKLQNVAERMKVPFKVVIKKVNSSAEMAWEHEAFWARKVNAATLSDRPTPSPQITRTSTFAENVNQTLLERNIILIAEAVAEHIYGAQVPNLTVFKGSTGINGRYVSSWIDFLSSRPRLAALLQKEDVLLNALSAELTKYIPDFQVDDDNKHLVDKRSDYKFYGNAINKMYIYKTKPFLFDVVYLCLTLLYLFVLFVTFKGWESSSVWKSRVNRMRGTNTHSSVSSSKPYKK